MQKLRVNENKQIKYTKRLVKEISVGKIHEGRGQVQQHDQNNGRGPGLMGYAI